MKYLYCILLAGLLSGCTTPSKPSTGSTSSSSAIRPIDLENLKLQLNMGRGRDELGYEEKTFDSCQVEPSPLANCGQKRFVLIHFRLQCRDSVGTVESVTNIELKPVRSRHIKWKTGYFAGTTSTDSDGYGQVQFISPGSSKKQRFILQIKENSLGVTASEVSRIIVPRDWCG